MLDFSCLVEHTSVKFFMEFGTYSEILEFKSRKMCISSFNILQCLLFESVCICVGNEIYGIEMVIRC